MDELELESTEQGVSDSLPVFEESDTTLEIPNAIPDEVIVAPDNVPTNEPVVDTPDTIPQSAEQVVDTDVTNSPQPAGEQPTGEQPTGEQPTAEQPTDEMTQEEFDKLGRNEKFAEYLKRTEQNKKAAIKPEDALGTDLTGVFSKELPRELTGYDEYGEPQYTYQTLTKSYESVEPTDLTPEQVSFVNDAKGKLNLVTGTYYSNSAETKELKRIADAQPLGKVVAEYAVEKGLLDREDNRYAQLLGFNDASVVARFPNLFKEDLDSFSTFRLELARRNLYDTKPFELTLGGTLRAIWEGTVAGSLDKRMGADDFTVSLTTDGDKLATRNIFGGLVGALGEGAVAALVTKGLGATPVLANTINKLGLVGKGIKLLSKHPIVAAAVETLLTTAAMNISDPDYNPTVAASVSGNLAFNNPVVAAVEGGVIGAGGAKALEAVMPQVSKGFQFLFKHDEYLKNAYGIGKVPVDDIDTITKEAYQLMDADRASAITDLNPSIKDVVDWNKTQGRLLHDKNYTAFRNQESLAQTEELKQLVEATEQLGDRLSKEVGTQQDLETYVTNLNKISTIVSESVNPRGKTPLSKVLSEVPVVNGKIVDDSGETVLDLTSIAQGKIPLTEAITAEQTKLLEAANVVTDDLELFKITDTETATAIINLRRLRQSFSPRSKDADLLAEELYKESDSFKKVDAYNKSVEQHKNKVNTLQNNYKTRVDKYNTDLSAYNTKINKPIEKAKAKIAELNKQIASANKRMQGVGMSKNVEAVTNLKKEIASLTKKRDKIKVPTMSEVKSKLGITKPRKPSAPRVPDAPIPPEGDVVTLEAFKKAFKTTIPKSLDNLPPVAKQRILDAAKLVTDTVGYKTKNVLLDEDELIAAIQKANADKVFSKSSSARVNEILTDTVTQSDLKQFKSEWDFAVKKAEIYEKALIDNQASAQKMIDNLNKVFDPQPLKTLKELVAVQERLRDDYIEYALNAKGRYTVKSKLDGKPIDIVDKQVAELLESTDNTAIYKQAKGMQNVIRAVYNQGGTVEDLMSNAYEFAIRAHKALQKQTATKVGDELLLKSIYSDSAGSYQTAIQQVADDLKIPYTKLLDDVIQRGGNTLSHLARVDAIASVHKHFETIIREELSKFDSLVKAGQEVDSSKVYTALKDLAAFRMKIGRAEEYMNITNRDALFNLMERVTQEQGDVLHLASSMQSVTSTWNRQLGLPNFVYPETGIQMQELITQIVLQDGKTTIADILDNSNLLFKAKNPIAKEITMNLFQYVFDANITKMLSGIPVAKVAAISNVVKTGLAVKHRVVGGYLTGNKALTNKGLLMVQSLFKQLYDVNEAVKLVRFTGEAITKDSSGHRYGFSTAALDNLTAVFDKIENPIAQKLAQGLNKAGKLTTLFHRAPLSAVDGITAKIAGTAFAEANAIEKAVKEGLHPSSPAFRKRVAEEVDAELKSLLTRSGTPTDTQKFVADITLTEALPANADINTEGIAIAFGSLVDRLLSAKSSSHPIMQVLFKNATLFATTLSRAADDNIGYIPWVGTKLSTLGKQAMSGDVDARSMLASKQLDGWLGFAGLTTAFWTGAITISPPTRTAEDARNNNIGTDKSELSISILGNRFSVRDLAGFAPFVSGIGYFTNLIKSEWENFEDPILRDQLDLGDGPTLLGSIEDVGTITSAILDRRLKDMAYGVAVFSGLNYVPEFLENLYKTVTVNGSIKLDALGNPSQMLERLQDLVIPTWVQQSSGEPHKIYSPFYDGKLAYALSIGDKSTRAAILERMGRDAEESMFLDHNLYGEPKKEESTLAVVKEDTTDEAIKEMFRIRNKDNKALKTDFTSYENLDSRNMFINGVNVYNLRNQILSTTVSEDTGRTLKEALNVLVNSTAYQDAADVKYLVVGGKMQPVRQTTDSQSKAGMVQTTINHYHELADATFKRETLEYPIMIREGSKEYPLQSRSRQIESVTEAAQLNTQAGVSTYRDVKSLGYINSP
jgi:hypothetical protein